MDPSIINNTNKNVDHHYKNLLLASDIEIEKGNDAEIHLKNPKVLRNCLNNEYEKMLLNEGISYYLKNFEKLATLQKPFKNIGESKTEVQEQSSSSSARFLPFFYGFVSKVLN